PLTISVPLLKIAPPCSAAWLALMSWLLGAPPLIVSEPLLKIAPPLPAVDLLPISMLLLIVSVPVLRMPPPSALLILPLSFTLLSLRSPLLAMPRRAAAWLLPIVNAEIVTLVPLLIVITAVPAPPSRVVVSAAAPAMLRLLARVIFSGYTPVSSLFVSPETARTSASPSVLQGVALGAAWLPQMFPSPPEAELTYQVTRPAS